METKDNIGKASSTEEKSKDKLDRNMVVVKASEYDEDDIRLVEEEVPQSVIIAKSRAAMPNKNLEIDYSSELKSMIGSQLDSIEGYLNELQEKKVFSTWRKVPIGMARTMEMEPGRVSVVVDLTDKVIDIEIS